jgi:hypothetical protein
MTSATYGMLTSLCMVPLDMYQGALASFLHVLDWKLCLHKQPFYLIESSTAISRVGYSINIPEPSSFT